MRGNKSAYPQIWGTSKNHTNALRSKANRIQYIKQLAIYILQVLRLGKCRTKEKYPTPKSSFCLVLEQWHPWEGLTSSFTSAVGADISINTNLDHESGIIWGMICCQFPKYQYPFLGWSGEKERKKMDSFMWKPVSGLFTVVLPTYPC